LSRGFCISHSRLAAVSFLSIIEQVGQCLDIQLQRGMKGAVMAVDLPPSMKNCKPRSFSRAFFAFSSWGLIVMA
jgi:hypothetical protein